MKVSIEYTKDGKDKVSISIEGGDLWDGDVTLARIIFPFLKKYRKLYERKHGTIGYPAAFAPDPFKPEGPDNPDRFQDWLICLEKLIYSFEWIAKHKDSDGPAAKEYYKERAKLLKPYRKELKRLSIEDDKRFKEAKPHTALESLAWNRRSEITEPLLLEYIKKFEEHRKKLQEGIDLFAKYFRHLWL
jgi:hypothetical protein